jgi:hypothetical protein
MLPYRWLLSGLFCWLMLCCASQKSNFDVIGRASLQESDPSDELKERLNRLSHLEAYATITVDLQEKVKPGLIGYVFVGLYQGVKWLFVRN